MISCKRDRANFFLYVFIRLLKSALLVLTSHKVGDSKPESFRALAELST